MEETIYKAFAEVDDILDHSEKNIRKKIPDRIRSIFKNYKDEKYNIEIDYLKNINAQKLLPETRQILALIYRDYLCSEKEKIRLIEKDRVFIEELKEKYDITKIFDEKKNKKEQELKEKLEKQEKEENTSLIVQKKKWYIVIFEKILNFFRKK